jgi:hypothetical protein
MKKNNFYTYSTILLMLILPLVSIVIEFIFFKNGNLMFLVGKWFIFWSIGIRLFTAGFKQATNPAFTLENIFDIQNKESQVVVRELGFANICMGFLGIISLFIEQFRLSAAITGGLYFGLTGLLHVFKKRDNKNETFAMVSDLFIFILMLVFVIEKL